MLVLTGYTRSEADDKDVSETDDEGDHPHEHPKDDVRQQMLKRGDAISVRLAASHVGRVAAVLKALEIAEHIQRDKQIQTFYWQSKDIITFFKEITSQ